MGSETSCRNLLLNKQGSRRRHLSHPRSPSFESCLFTRGLTCNLPSALNSSATATWDEVRHPALFSLSKFTGAEWDRSLFSMNARLVSFSSSHQGSDIRRKHSMCSGQIALFKVGAVNSGPSWAAFRPSNLPYSCANGATWRLEDTGSLRTLWKVLQLFQRRFNLPWNFLFQQVCDRLIDLLPELGQIDKSLKSEGDFRIVTASNEHK